MSYATQADIEARYPGWLKIAQASDPVAIALACAAADDPINRALHTIGWSVPVAGPVPGWLLNLAVEMAAYLAGSSAPLSQDDLADRRKRYDDALKALDDIATGKVQVPALSGATAGGVFVASAPRQFGRGAL